MMRTPSSSTFVTIQSELVWFRQPTIIANSAGKSSVPLNYRTSFTTVGRPKMNIAGFAMDASTIFENGLGGR
jgi:hypothetical protein